MTDLEEMPGGDDLPPARTIEQSPKSVLYDGVLRCAGDEHVWQTSAEDASPEANQPCECRGRVWHNEADRIRTGERSRPVTIADLGTISDDEREVLNRAHTDEDKSRATALLLRAREINPPIFVRVEDGDRKGFLHFKCGGTTYNPIDVASMRCSKCGEYIEQ